jgi:hypothetical protein
MIITLKEYIGNRIDWQKETGYLKQTAIAGSGGKGGTTEKVSGFRAVIHSIDEKGTNSRTMIPPVQYKPAKDKNKIKEYIKKETSRMKKRGGFIRKVEIEKA